MERVKKQRRQSQLESNLPIIKDLYCKYKKNTYEIGEIFNRSPSHINYLLQREGVQLRQRTLKYDTNEDFFSKIDNKIKAYWFGFLCADGHNSTKSNYISILLALRDVNVLKAFKKALQFSGVIRYRTIAINGKLYKMCYIQVYNPKISKDLLKLGCGNRKSLTLEFPKLPESFIWHFLRGYFDGDGHIYKASPQLEICCSYPFANSLKIFLEKHDISSYIYKDENSKIHKLRIGKKKDSLAFCGFLYENCHNLKLNRKYRTYVKHRKKNPSWP